MTNKRDFLKLLGAGVLGAAGIRALAPEAASRGGATASEDVFERILKDGILRAAYIVYPPYFVKDLNTGALSGLYYDMTMKLAADFGVKVEWVEEVSFSTPFEGLYTNRYDIVAANIWPNGSRVRRADFTRPVCYNGFNVYLRPDQTHRFKALQDLNRSDVRLALVEGEGFVPIAQEICPKANFLFLPNSVSNAELVLQLMTHKADATFLEFAFANNFLREHPNAIAPLMQDPLQVYPCGFSIARHQPSFRSLLDTLVETMVNTGFVEGLLKKYESASGDFIRVAKPYQSMAFS